MIHYSKMVDNKIYLLYVVAVLGIKNSDISQIKYSRYKNRKQSIFMFCMTVVAVTMAMAVSAIAF